MPDPFPIKLKDIPAPSRDLPDRIMKRVAEVRMIESEYLKFTRHSQREAFGTISIVIASMFLFCFLPFQSAVSVFNGVASAFAYVVAVMSVYPEDWQRAFFALIFSLILSWMLANMVVRRPSLPNA